MAKFFEIKKARNGLGVFAQRNFRAGSRLFEIRGQIVHYEKLNEIGGETQDNAFRYGLNTYLIVGESLPKYLNHSCEPNSRIVKENKKLYLTAIRNIKTGEEVVFDYSTILGADDIWVMRCNCGSRVCRKRVAKYTRLPKQVLEKYLAEQIIPKYILKFPPA